jgi:plastocyanin
LEKKRVVLLFGLAFLLAGCTQYTVVDTTPTPLETQEPLVTQTPKETPKTVVVNMSESGFKPQTIAIKTGDTVEFTNIGNTSMWPASAVHPTHQAYPAGGGCIGSAFDACKALAPGESWRFTFSQHGNWKYHDHLNPSLQGTITVE